MNPLVLKGLTPICYFNLSLDVIEHEENKCLFKKQIDNCQKMQKQIDIPIPKGICDKKTELITNNHHNSLSFISLLFMLICFTFGLICIYIILTPKRRLLVLNSLNKFSFYSRRQKLPIFTADSYQQLTHINENDDEQTSHKMMKIVVKYNSTTDQTQPYIHTNKSDFIVLNDINEDVTLKLNTNPLSDIEDNNQ